MCDQVVSGLPAALRSPIIESYSDALTPLFLYRAPLGVIAAILFVFVHEKELSRVIERDAPRRVEGAAADSDLRRERVGRDRQTS